jgi:hypothetical protein
MISETVRLFGGSKMGKSVRRGIIKEVNDLENGLITRKTVQSSTKKPLGMENQFPQNMGMMTLRNNSFLSILISPRKHF